MNDGRRGERQSLCSAAVLTLHFLGAAEVLRLTFMHGTLLLTAVLSKVFSGEI